MGEYLLGYMGAVLGRPPVLSETVPGVKKNRDQRFYRPSLDKPVESETQPAVLEKIRAVVHQ
jgi:hypothetical protein